MDTCTGVHDPEQKTVAEKLSELKAVSAVDGVHWTAVGYKNMGRNLKAAVISLQNGLIGKNIGVRSSAGLSVSGGTSSHFWRGFCSPVGSRGQSHVQYKPKSTRSWSYRTKGPYDSRGPGPKHQ